MKRRDFIKLLAASGMSASVVPMLSQKVFAANVAGGTDQYLIVIGADGGWDTTCLFDPKGQANGVNKVDLDDSLKTASGLQWSAISEAATSDADIRLRYADQYRRFFTTYDQDLTVIRGLNTLTVSHTVGARMKLSGMFGTYPCLSALYGAVYGPKLPLSFLTFGGRWSGSDYTAGLDVTKALLGDGSLISRLSTSSEGLDSAMHDLVTQGHIERLQRQITAEQADTGLSLRAKKLEELFNQRIRENLFYELQNNITLLENEGEANLSWYTGQSASLKQQAKITAAAIATGMTSTANLAIGNFDSHANNDPAQFHLLSELIEGIHYLVNALDFFGLANKTTIVVASDIGRSTKYNIDNGKDHSPYGGMLVLHPKGTNRGGKVFGASNESAVSMPIDLSTGLANDQGEVLNVRHMMLALRNHLGLQTKAAENDFNFDSSIILPSVFV